MTVYRLTKYYCGCWHDIKENGETFNYDNEQDIKSTLEAVNYRNSYGERLNYRVVSDKEQEQELASYAASMAASMYE
jgi:hypothetical protein